MNTTRRIHLNPQSKGNLGKSFEAEFRTAWLDQLGACRGTAPTSTTGITRLPTGIRKRCAHTFLVTNTSAKPLC